MSGCEEGQGQEAGHGLPGLQTICCFCVNFKVYLCANFSFEAEIPPEGATYLASDITSLAKAGIKTLRCLAVRTMWSGH
jgi:hypothetical protein